MPRGRDRAGSEHRVKFHENDSELVSTVTSFLGRALEAGGHAVAIATPEHLRKIEDRLIASGSLLSEPRPPIRYLALDAVEVLESIRAGPNIDPCRFDMRIGDIIADACEIGGPVVAFGEMVDLLVEDGLMATALELENLWNLLAIRVPFQLLCGYSTTRTYVRELSTARLLCMAHSKVTPPSSYQDPSALSAGRHSASEAIEVFFPVESAAMKARHFVDSVLERWKIQFIADEILIIASELTSNAIMHARSPFEVRLIRQPDTLRIEVSDGSRVRPPSLVNHEPGRRVSGRGLAMVDALASRWGSERRPDGKYVWAELECVGVR